MFRSGASTAAEICVDQAQCLTRITHLAYMSRSMARPQKDIDAKQVEKLASYSCSVAEISAVLDCHPRTIQRRFAVALEKGRQCGDASLKRKQFEYAMKGDRALLIWLGKVRLGQREQYDVSHEHRGTVVVAVSELQAAITAAQSAPTFARAHGHANGNGNGHAPSDGLV